MINSRAFFFDIFGLNNEQISAVESPLQSTILVFAGPGTGKTRILSCRYIYILLNHELNSDCPIMALSFTNKAANEIRERIHIYADKIESKYPIKNAIQNQWIGTFHSICLKILRQNLSLTEYFNGMQVIDMQSQSKVIENLLELKDKNKKLKNIATNFINQFKESVDYFEYFESLLTSKLSNTSQISELDSKFWTRYMQNHSEYKSLFENIHPSILINKYQQHLSHHGMIDFSDLISKTVELFCLNPDILEKYREYFKAILVDEYQDTNHMQRKLIKLLNHSKCNLFCVGDDDQSIYSWRGAGDSMLNFTHDFENANILKLSQNYRSTVEIIHTAQSLIRHNVNRVDKNLSSSHNIHGNSITITQYDDYLNEAKIISRQISMICAENSTKSIAILVRNNAQIIPFEDEFTVQKIPYKIVGESKFYDYKEIKYIVYYIQSAMNIMDDISFEKILNFPKRGLGEVFLSKLKGMAKSSLQESCVSLCNKSNSEFSEKTISSVSKLITVLSTFKREMDSNNDHVFDIKQFNLFDEKILNQLKILTKNSIAKAILHLLLNSGIYEDCIALDSIDARSSYSRLDLLKRLIEMANNFANIHDFLDAISLHVDNSGHNELQNIFIMTMHGAKGLEFDDVFLPGWEMGILPNGRALDEKNGIEEERRLAYVAITRAKKNVNISYSASRRVDGLWKIAVPSSFIIELDKRYVTSSLDRFEKFHKLRKVSHQHSICSEYKIGTVVEHAQFGTGLIISIDREILSIRFESGVKHILKSFVKKKC
ncbi:ATP-dependent helicase [Candidatus Gromoviella agglomerans]|uniref:ATP-dependent helicase n=1 Tax=Candidatus Gromoviella agglomerans TaxID=2806609 RepID=UPI001E30684C|nr:UvrD-helicase domain-containing protein [Candidatus Gromoviella agglomerans]UFX98200.1 DNA helicase II [Candidatus Gromoviella agglomerans]